MPLGHQQTQGSESQEQQVHICPPRSSPFPQAAPMSLCFGASYLLQHVWRLASRQPCQPRVHHRRDVRLDKGRAEARAAAAAVRQGLPAVGAQQEVIVHGLSRRRVAADAAARLHARQVRKGRQAAAGVAVTVAVASSSGVGRLVKVVAVAGACRPSAATPASEGPSAATPASEGPSAATPASEGPSAGSGAGRGPYGARGSVTSASVLCGCRQGGDNPGADGALPPTIAWIESSTRSASNASVTASAQLARSQAIKRPPACSCCGCCPRCRCGCGRASSGVGETVDDAGCSSSPSVLAAPPSGSAAASPACRLVGISSSCSPPRPPVAGLRPGSISSPSCALARPAAGLRPGSISSSCSALAAAPIMSSSSAMPSEPSAPSPAPGAVSGGCVPTVGASVVGAAAPFVASAMVGTTGVRAAAPAPATKSPGSAASAPSEKSSS
eukprot:353529-Chlamydomonas_euryale.AAC.4